MDTSDLTDTTNQDTAELQKSHVNEYSAVAGNGTETIQKVRNYRCK